MERQSGASEKTWHPARNAASTIPPCSEGGTDTAAASGCSASASSSRATVRMRNWLAAVSRRSGRRSKAMTSSPAPIRSRIRRFPIDPQPITNALRRFVPTTPLTALRYRDQSSWLVECPAHIASRRGRVACTLVVEPVDCEDAAVSKLHGTRIAQIARAAVVPQHNLAVHIPGPPFIAADARADAERLLPIAVHTQQPAVAQLEHFGGIPPDRRLDGSGPRPSLVARFALP